MAQGIYLKDGSGNSVSYEAVDQIKIGGYGADGNAKTHKYTKMQSLNAYAIVSSDVISGGYRVTKSISIFPSDDCIMSEFSVEDCETYGYEADGSYKLLLFLTPKTLTVGSDYAVADMY